MADDEIYCVTTYMVNQKIKDYTRKLIKFLKERNKQVLLISHHPISTEFQEMVDYCIYDNRNHLLYENKHKGWICYRNNLFYVESQEFFASNSTLACYYFYSALFFSKFINKKIVHFIDYDSNVSNLDQYDENYKILKDSEYTSVRYKTTSGASFDNKAFQAFFADTSSINLSKYNLDNLIISDEKFKSLMEKFRTYEILFENHFLKFEKIYWKPKDELEKSITAGLEHIHGIDWVGLAVELSQRKFYITIINDSEKSKTHKIIIDEKIIYMDIASKNSWVCDVSGNNNVIVYSEKGEISKSYHIPSINMDDQSKISWLTFNPVNTQL